MGEGRDLVEFIVVSSVLIWIFLVAVFWKQSREFLRYLLNQVPAQSEDE